MNTKHTPGPWVIGEESFVERTGALDYVPVMKHNNGVVAFAFTNCLVKSDERCRANARLIAAAPELLDALRILAAYPVEEFALEGKPERKLFGANDWELMVSQVLAARTAIAKATGEHA